MNTALEDIIDHSEEFLDITGRIQSEQVASYDDVVSIESAFPGFITSRCDIHGLTETASLENFGKIKDAVVNAIKAIIEKIKAFIRGIINFFKGGSKGGGSSGTEVAKEVEKNTKENEKVVSEIKKAKLPSQKNNPDYHKLPEILKNNPDFSKHEVIDALSTLTASQLAGYILYAAADIKTEDIAKLIVNSNLLKYNFSRCNKEQIAASIDQIKTLSEQLPKIQFGAMVVLNEFNQILDIAKSTGDLEEAKTKIKDLTKQLDENSLIWKHISAKQLDLANTAAENMDDYAKDELKSKDMYSKVFNLADVEKLRTTIRTQVETVLKEEGDSIDFLDKPLSNIPEVAPGLEKIKMLADTYKKMVEGKPINDGEGEVFLYTPEELAETAKAAESVKLIFLDAIKIMETVLDNLEKFNDKLSKLSEDKQKIVAIYYTETIYKFRDPYKLAGVLGLAVSAANSFTKTFQFIIDAIKTGSDKLETVTQKLKEGWVKPETAEDITHALSDDNVKGIEF